MLELNQAVKWNDAPGYCSEFSECRVRGISPCKRFVLLGWFRCPVPIEQVSLATKPLKDVSLYAPIVVNEWGIDGIDTATKVNLTERVKEYDRKRSAAAKHRRSLAE